MRIVWKDTKKEFKSYQYRKHNIVKVEQGWVTDVAGDDNIYYSAEMAHNAIDKMLGGETRKKNPRRHQLGIKVVGKKGGEDSCA